MNTYAYVSGNPISFVDPWGLAPGDPFSSPGAAANDALNYINPTSIAQNTEYAGTIYQDPATSSYYAYPPNAGGPAGSNAWHLYFPKGMKWVGDYHTHGNYTDKNGCPTDKSHDIMNSDHFSVPDLQWRPPALAAPDYTRYLGTPGGNFLQYTPGWLSSPKPFRF